MPSDQGGVNGRVAVGVTGIDLRRRRDQDFDGLQVPVAAGEVQRRVVVRQQAFVDDRSVHVVLRAFDKQRGGEGERRRRI